MGTQRINDVKIVILGCHGGYHDSEIDYPSLVAKGAHSPVMGPVDSYAAGNPDTVVRDLKIIQQGKVPKGFRLLR